MSLVYRGQTAGWMKMPLGTEVGLGTGDIVLDGELAPPPKKGEGQFSAHVCCGQTARWIMHASVHDSGGHFKHTLRLQNCFRCSLLDELYVSRHA